jgi:hypothetical protein
MKRIFKKASPYVGNTVIKSKVAWWEWTKGHGLFVVFTDGLKTKSDYTLKELLSGKPEGLIYEVGHGNG